MNENSDIIESLEGQGERLRECLNLRRSIPGLKEAAVKKIEDAIVQTVFDLTPSTGLSLKDISVHISEGDAYGSVDDNILFYWDSAANKADICFVRKFILDIGERMGKNSIKGAEAEAELMSKTAHEMCHIREAKRFPQRFERTSAIRLDWAEDRAELAGQVFTLQYLKTKPQTLAIKREISRLTKNIKDLKKHRRKEGY